MTKEELKKATGQELIEQRDYCGRDNYYYEYLENINAEMLKRFNRLAELEAQNKWLEGCKLELGEHLGKANDKIADLEKENAELRKVAEFQQSSNMSRHFENKKLKEGLAVGSTFNKALNSMNKNLEEERDKYRNMVFDKDDQLTKAKEIIRDFISVAIDYIDKENKNYSYIVEAEQFIKDSEVE